MELASILHFADRRAGCALEMKAFQVFISLLILHYATSLRDELQVPSSEKKAELYRIRRRVNKYRGSGPYAYMKQLRESLVDDDGALKNAENGPTSVWLLMDNDIMHEKYRPKPMNRKCQMQQKFNFSLSSLSSESTSLDVYESIFRVRLQPIQRLLPTDNETVDIMVSITARVLSNTSECSGVKSISSHIITVTSKTHDYWDEWNITQGLRDCLENFANVSHVLIDVTFERIQCLPGHKKIPIAIADPGTIPVTEELRRKRHWPLQPFVLVFIDDYEVKEELVQEELIKKELRKNEPFEPEGPMIDELAHNDRMKRDEPKGCGLKNYSINFSDLGLHNVLYPFSFNARQCSGNCLSVREQDIDIDVNNHARLFSTARRLYNSHKWTHLPAPETPGCVSIWYSSLSIIVVEKSAITLKVYSNMIAEQCACRA